MKVVKREMENIKNIKCDFFRWYNIWNENFTEWDNNRLDNTEKKGHWTWKNTDKNLSKMKYRAGKRADVDLWYNTKKANIPRFEVSKHRC